MKIPENHVAVRIRKVFDGGAILNDAGQPIKGLGGELLVSADKSMHLDEELLNKPGAVCIAEIVLPCPAFTEFPEVLAIGDDMHGSELFVPGEVVAGDVVAIKQNEMDVDTAMYTDETGPVHFAPYSALLCILRAPGRLVPVGGYTLGTAIYPPRTEKELVEGKIARVIKNAGLIVEADVQPLTGQARLAFVGKALRGQAMPYFPGARVLYHRWTSGPAYRIDGVDYFAVRHPDISAVVGEHEEVLSLGEARFSRSVARPTRAQFDEL